MKKRVLTLLLTGCLVLSMTACGSKNGTTENTESTSTENSGAHVHTNNSKLVKLGKYKGVTYKPMDVTVSDEEVEEEVQYMLKSSYTKSTKEVVTETSIVNIDFEGKKDGVAFEGGTAQGQELDIANSTYIDGFAESIVGMKVGETKDCPMTFPEDYGVDELNGAEVVFTITVNECWEKVPAELNDEFAVNNGYDNVDALYKGIREALQLSKKHEATNDRIYKVIQKVIENSELSIDEAEVEHYVEDTKAQYEQYAAYYGYDLETYILYTTGMELSEFEEACKEEALFSIQTSLIKDEIEKKENITVSDEVYAERVKEYIIQYGYDTVEELEAEFGKEAIIEQIKYDLVLELLSDNAVEESTENVEESTENVEESTEE